MFLARNLVPEGGKNVGFRARDKARFDSIFFLANEPVFSNAKKKERKKKNGKVFHLNILVKIKR